MSDVLAENLRMRLAHLDESWEGLATRAGLKPGNVRDWVRRASPRGDTLEQLARLLGVPAHELLNPQFNPRAFPPPRFEETDGVKDDQANSD